MGEIPEAETNNNTLDNTTWKVDKRIPLALIFIFVCQTLGVVWAAAMLSAEVHNLRTTTTRLETRIDGLSDKLDDQQRSYVSRSENTIEREYFYKRLHDLEIRVRELELHRVGK